MKKKIIYFFIVLSIFLFTNCKSKKSELERKIQELQSENDILKNEISEYKKTIDLLEKKDLNNTELYDNHKINYTLQFTNSGYNTKVFEQPNDSEKAIYTIQQGDVVEVYNIITVRRKNKTFIKIRTSSGIEGFIKLSENPYKDGAFTVKETIQIDGKNINILKLEENFWIYQDVTIKALPSENAANLHTITYEESIDRQKVYAITSDYKWVNIVVGEYNGWIPLDDIYVNMGGFTVYTPENRIYWDLIGSNEI